MIHNPIILNTISFILPHKTCFEPFSARIHYAQRIGIIGNNGSGKSTLLKIIQQLTEPSTGFVSLPPNVHVGYVPQILDTDTTFSGGQRFNHALTQALAQHPNVLCLDEPTNNLDKHNRASLIRMLKNYHGTLIMISHDQELLRSCVDQVWAVEDGVITTFTGGYDTYIHEQALTQKKRLATVQQLKKEQRVLRNDIQAEHKRAAHSKRANTHENDVNIIYLMRESGTTTHSTKQKRLNIRKDRVNAALADIHIPETITPDFSLHPSQATTNKTILTIEHGSCGYHEPLLNHINLQIKATERVALIGNNGSGKSTLLKAIFNDSSLQQTGVWHIPSTSTIGYFDQHYTSLNPEYTVFQTIEHAVSDWSINNIRTHLNNFLFRKNEDVTARVATLSGGEKARLSLALIAAQNPTLLLLDEITNNLDLTAREQVIQVLKVYPGAFIVISHDMGFLEQIHIDSWYTLEKGIFTHTSQ